MADTITTVDLVPGTMLYRLDEHDRPMWEGPTLTDVDGSEQQPLVSGVQHTTHEVDLGGKTLQVVIPYVLLRFCDGEEYALPLVASVLALGQALAEALEVDRAL